jgi:hypothetical protein
MKYKMKFYLYAGNIVEISYSGGNYFSSKLTSVAALREALLSRNQFNIEQELGGSIPDLERNAKRILEWLG